MDTLLWLIMLVGFIFWIVRVFGGAKSSPQWLVIVTGIILSFDFLVFVYACQQLSI